MKELAPDWIASYVGPAPYVAGTSTDRGGLRQPRGKDVKSGFNVFSSRTGSHCCLKRSDVVTVRATVELGLLQDRQEQRQIGVFVSISRLKIPFGHLEYIGMITRRLLELSTGPSAAAPPSSGKNCPPPSRKSERREEGPHQVHPRRRHRPRDHD